MMSSVPQKADKLNLSLSRFSQPGFNSFLSVGAYVFVSSTSASLAHMLS